MSQALWGVLVGGLVGVAGILGTFFAPNWQSVKAERRQSLSALRRATRLVGHELELNAKFLRFAARVVADAVQTVGPVEFEYTAWRANSETLAGSEDVTDDLWQRLAREYSILETAGDALPNMRGRIAPGPHLV